MATGNRNGARYTPAASRNQGTAQTSAVLAAGATASFRLAMVVIGSTTATFSSVPPGWIKVFDDATAPFRLGLFAYPRWDTADTTTTHTWGFSASVVSMIASNSWEGIEPDDPWLLPPSTSTMAGSTSNATSLVLPSMTYSPPYGMGLWWWAIRPSGSASSATTTLPSDLVNVSNPTPTGSSNAFYGRSGAYLDTANAGVDTPSPAGTRTLGASVAGPWRGLGMVLRTRPRAGDHHHAAAA